MNMNLTQENIVEGITIADTKDIPSDVQAVLNKTIGTNEESTLTAAYYIGSKEEMGGVDHFIAMKQTAEEGGKTVRRFVVAELFVTSQTVKNEEGEDVVESTGTVRKISTSYDFSTNPELKNAFNQITAQDRRTKYTAIWLFGINGDDFYVLANTQSTMRGMKPVLSTLKINKADGNLSTTNIVGF